MQKIVKKVIKKFFGFFSLRVMRVDHRQVSDANRFAWLKEMGIKTIIDIGASKGKAAKEFHLLLPEASIFSFEPLPDCFTQMNAAMRNVSNFFSFNIALGDVAGQTQMYRSSYSGSSSFRKMASLHKVLYPITAKETPIVVTVDTLDHALRGYSLRKEILVKIDTQGFEDKVIRGGISIFQQARVVIVETSFSELYEGQPLFGNIYKLLHDLGFVYSGAWAPELKSPINGALLQQDSIFIKK